MAIKIYEQFKPFANPADGDHPYGSFKNDSIPGAEDGTPLDAVWANDYAGTDAELFAQAGIVPSGQPDKLGNSQRVDALREIFALNSSFNVLKFGAVGDGVTDDTAAIQSAVNAAREDGGGEVILPTGVYLVTSTIDLFQGGAIPLILRGFGKSTKITTPNPITVFLHAENCDFVNLSVEKTGAVGGEAFATTSTKQAAYCRYEKLSITGFKFGVWWRFSLWNSLRDVTFKNCACGLKASRNALKDDQSNPPSAGGWNLQTGFFHNQNTFQNVLCEGGEVGIWGTFNGCVFDNVTCQLQVSQTGADNVVIPTGVQGIGLYLQGGFNTADRFGAQGNHIVNYYSEFTRQAIVADSSQFKISSFYIQGGASSDKYPQPIKAINGSIADGVGCAASGTDWFDNRIVAIDSTLYGEIGVGSSNGSLSSLTNSKWFRNVGSGVGVNLDISLTGDGATATLYNIGKRLGAIQVTMTMLQDGYLMRQGTWTVHFWQSGTSSVVASPTNNIGGNITVVGSDIVYTSTSTVQQLAKVEVIPLALLGQTRDTGLYIVN